VEPRQKNFVAYSGATLFKPGIEELEKHFDIRLSTKSETELGELMVGLDQKIGAKSYLISLDDGDIFFHSKDVSKVFPTHHTGVADMSGVGNAIISVAGLSLTLGLK